MFKTIDINALSFISGGTQAGFNTGITGGMRGMNNKVPHPYTGPAYNTGITGGLSGINNYVPPPHAL
jgi:hypothetical protein